MFFCFLSSSFVFYESSFFKLASYVWKRMICLANRLHVWNSFEFSGIFWESRFAEHFLVMWSTAVQPRNQSSKQKSRSLEHLLTRYFLKSWFDTLEGPAKSNTCVFFFQFVAPTRRQTSNFWVCYFLRSGKNFIPINQIVSDDLWFRTK